MVLSFSSCLIYPPLWCEQFFTLTVWWAVPVIWLPVVCWSVSRAVQMGVPSAQVAASVVGGIFIWTLLEYSLHRFLFHIKTTGYWLNTSPCFLFSLAIVISQLNWNRVRTHAQASSADLPNLTSYVIKMFYTEFLKMYLKSLYEISLSHTWEKLEAYLLQQISASHSSKQMSASHSSKQMTAYGVVVHR